MAADAEAHLAQVEDPLERILEGMMFSLEEIRRRPVQALNGGGPRGSGRGGRRRPPDQAVPVLVPGPAGGMELCRPGAPAHFVEFCCGRAARSKGNARFGSGSSGKYSLYSDTASLSLETPQRSSRNLMSSKSRRVGWARIFIANIARSSAATISTLPTRDIGTPFWILERGMNCSRREIEPVPRSPRRSAISRATRYDILGRIRIDVFGRVAGARMPTTSQLHQRRRPGHLLPVR